MTQVSSLYIHVPFCRHLCNYCDFYKRTYDPSSRQFEDFHQFLHSSFERHMELMKEESVSWAPLETLYLGGGTPSLWGASGAGELARLLQDLERGTHLEFTMEIDPGTWTDEMINAWKEIGLNRISIGTQSLNSEFLKIMDRDHTLEESHRLLEYCHQNDWNFSLDFLLGLPYSWQKRRNIQQELDDLLSYGPKHVSLYILNARSKYPHTQVLPEDDYIREEYLFVSNYLKSKGFLHYEVSNFALPGYESRHNLKYWKSEAVAALGPTGTGFFQLTPERALRYKWKVTHPEIEREYLGKEEMELEATYLALRTSLGWDPPSSKSLGSLLERWVSEGYAQFEQGRVILTSLGYLMLDSLMDDLFRAEIR